MKRQEYYAKRRAERMARPRGTLSVATMAKVFNEYYSFILGESDQAVFDLIKRYDAKVSSRLQALRKELERKGRASGQNMMRDLVYSPNALLTLLKGK